MLFGAVLPVASKLKLLPVRHWFASWAKLATMFGPAITVILFVEAHPLLSVIVTV